MANKKITDLTEVSSFTSDDDLIPIVINTDTVPSNASISKANLQTAVGGGAVDSVNGEVGVVVLDTDDINEGTTNEYYTEAKVSANTDVVANTAKNSYPSADATKLSGIEAGAEVNDTAAEIKTKYESNSNTNVFTDSEKTNLGNQSGINTGDQDLSGLQATLVSGTNIKTINSTSLLGSGDIAISGGGGITKKEFTFGRRIDFNADGRWVGHYNSEDGAQVLNWNRGTGTDASIPNYYGFILLEPNSTLKKLVLSAKYDSTYTAIDIQIWGGAVNQTTVTKLYSGSFTPIAPDTTLQSYDRYELDMGDIVLNAAHRLFVAVKNQQTTLASKTVRGQIKLIWEES